MFRQLLTPVGDSLGLSFLIAILPVVAVLVLLGLLRRPAWQAALAGLIVGLMASLFLVFGYMGVPVAFSLIAYIVVYVTVYSFGFYYIYRLLRDGPAVEVAAALPGAARAGALRGGG